MATQTVETNTETLVGLYVMYYRSSTAGNGLLIKVFRFHGTLKGARERAEKHCNTMGYKLNFVQPFVANLDLEEAHKLGNTIVCEGC